MVQLSSCKRPPRMLPGVTELTCIVASPVLRRGQPNGGIVQESGPTRSLVAKLPQRSSLAVRKFHATN